MNRSSSRPRRAQALLLVTLVAGALGVPSLVAPAAAQTFTSLATEFVAAQPVLHPAEIFAVEGTCDPEAASSFTFQASGHAGGVLQGTFTESGSFTIGPFVGTNQRHLPAYESTFEIHGSGGVEIVGTKQLVLGQAGSCFDDGTNKTLSFVGQATYDAVVTGPLGSFSVSGTAIVRGTHALPLETHFEDGLNNFTSTFITSTPLAPRPGIVFLEPGSADRATGAEHCVTATVWSSGGTAIAGSVVRFTSQLVPAAGASALTDGNGRATFCYIGPAEPGIDTIRAFADSDDDGLEEPGEPSAHASVRFFTPQTPPVPTTVSVEPADATVSAGGEHCVTATVLDQRGDPLPGTPTWLSIAGVGDPGETANARTDGNGQARLCYLTAPFAGVDSLRVFADADEDGVEDAGEPFAIATLTISALPDPPRPADLRLDPRGATADVGAEQCVTATVRDGDGALMAAVTIRFAVSGASQASGVATTDAGGKAAFCYTGPASPGADTVGAYADTNGDGIPDADEPSDAVMVLFTAPPADTVPASLTLAPAAATSTVGGQHCVTATVRAAAGQLVEQAAVRFTATGASAASGSAFSNAQGEAELCYVSPLFPGTDAIRAFADVNGDGVETPGEPAGDASVTFVLPASSPDCDVEDHGTITLANGATAMFGSHAYIHKDGAVRHKQTYEDPSTQTSLKTLALLTLTCDAQTGRATIYGQGIVNETRGVLFRVSVQDSDHPGAGADAYGIVIDNGYASGERVLASGQVKFH